MAEEKALALEVLQVCYFALVIVGAGILLSRESLLAPAKLWACPAKQTHTKYFKLVES